MFQMLETEQQDPLLRSILISIRVQIIPVLLSLLQIIQMNQLLKSKAIGLLLHEKITRFQHRIKET